MPDAPSRTAKKAAVLWGLLALLGTGCGPELPLGPAPFPDPSWQAGQSLIGGTEDSGHAYVVAIDEALCTGTVISARTVLTAAHCIDAGSTLQTVKFGATVSGAERTISVAQVVRHPDYVKKTKRNDLLLIQLSEDAPVPPAPLFRGTLKSGSTFIGRNLTFVGFGRTVWIADTSGTKKVTTLPAKGLGPKKVGGKVGSIDETMFYYSNRGDHTCNGDSGGPSLQVREGVEQQVGVTSHGEVYCRDVGVQARTDSGQLSSFIQPTLDSFEPANACRNDGICDASCNRDGLVWDPDCQKKHCAADGLCATACAMPVDPDCSFLQIDHCIRDGMCDPSCATPDVDCEAMP